eukprot:623905-Hanusia_phi.AAC.2
MAEARDAMESLLMEVKIERRGRGRGTEARRGGERRGKGRGVEEQINEARASVHGAANKFEEGKEFEAAAAERAKESQLSEATRRKLQRRSQILSAEVKSELSRAVAQLRHTSHHYKHVKNEIETALRHKDRKLAELSKAEGKIQGLEELVDDQKKTIQQLNKVRRRRGEERRGAEKRGTEDRRGGEEERRRGEEERRG